MEFAPVSLSLAATDVCARRCPRPEGCGLGGVAWCGESLNGFIGKRGRKSDGGVGGGWGVGLVFAELVLIVDQFCYILGRFILSEYFGEFDI